MARALPLAAALCLSGCSAQPAVTPHRIVSDNPCVDAILYAVASPEQIGAVSHYSQDPRATSVPLDWVQRFPAIGGEAEEIIAARPALYLTGSPVAPAKQAAVARAGISTLALGVPKSIAESEAQVRTVAHAIGRDAAGASLITQLQAAARPHPPVHRGALIYQGGGLVLGQGTLADDLLTRAGFINAARAFGGKPWDVVPLEKVLMQPPQLILAPHDVQGESGRILGLLRTMMRHSGRALEIKDFSHQLLYCGAGSIVRARARLDAIRDEGTEIQ